MDPPALCREGPTILNLSKLSVPLVHPSIPGIKEGKTSLHVAIECGSLPMVRLLVERRADVNTLDSTGKAPLDYGLAKKRLELIEYLRSCGGLIAGGIFEAAEKGDMARLAARIEEYPPIVNAKDGKTGDTPLLYAARGRKVAAMNLLITKNADVNAKNSEGKGVLHFAAKAGYDDIMALLIEKGIDIKEPDRSGNTPLHYAAMSGVVRAAKNPD